MIAARFRLLGWVAGCAGAALVCYMASQSVAAERSALARVGVEIARTNADIDRLRTEITARSRAGQIERWNGVLALQAARPVQYVSSGIQLASLAGGQPLPLDPAIVASHGAIDTVRYDAPAGAPPSPSLPPPALPRAVVPTPVVTPEQPLLRRATFVQQKPTVLAQPALIRAAYERPARRLLATESAIEEPTRPEKKAEKKPAGKTAAAAKAAGSKPAAARIALLPDDLGRLAAAERKAKPKGTM